MPAGRIQPPRSWRQPESHYVIALDSEWYRAVVGIQDALTVATVQFWSARGLKFGHLPVTTGSVSSPMGLGSDSFPVEVELSGVPTFLADSMQFSLEYMCRLSPAGAFYLMPSFRGEASDTTHLSQFFHSEAEIPGGLDEIIIAVEQYLRHLGEYLLSNHADLIIRLAGDLSHVESLVSRQSAFSRLTFDEAMALLGEPGSVTSDGAARWRSLTRQGERELLDRAGQFVWVTHWDHLAVPFYQAYSDDRNLALNADLLFGPGEVAGAGERHVTGNDVREALKAHDVPIDNYTWYATMKDLTPIRTAGFGLGMERFMMWLLRNDDIRDFQIFVRENGRNIVP